ncbi:MAG: glucosamine-6-phosphate deaminase [Dehalococcoidia bacterium]|nr:glucosamine-6-phosphate deaminase [Dehalococcoidia bacterium]
MRIRIATDPGALACAGADLVAAVLRERPDAVLGLPTGDTPIGLYDELQRRVEAGAVDLSRAVGWAIDEFSGVPRAAPGTNSVFYRAHVRLPLRALQIPNPAARDPAAHIAAFADALRRAGGFDLCILGIGMNGHIAFNEPGSARDSRARVVTLAAGSRAAHAADFGGVERVPARALTLGIADLLGARRLLVLASGRAKAAIVRVAVVGPVKAEVPASWLQQHDDCTWLLDQEAAAELQGRSLSGDAG